MPDNQEESPPNNTEYKCDNCGATDSNVANFAYDTANNKTYCLECGAACKSCGDVDLRDNLRTNNEGTPYCEDCYSEEYFICPACDEESEKEEYLPPTNKNRFGDRKEGGCTQCSSRCSSCRKVVDKDGDYSYEGEDYCESCFNDRFTSCDKCNETISNDDAHYLEHHGSFCESCYNENFTRCKNCDADISVEEAKSLDGESYCEDCYQKISIENIAPFKPLIENLSDFSWTKKDRLLDKVIKLVPISVRELKSKHGPLANGLSDLIAFAGGKTITAEIVMQFRESQGVENFPVEYSTWTELQRATESLPREARPEVPQLVLKIIASDKMLGELESVPSLYDLFDNINNISNKSTHPYSKNQVGWARLELDPNKNFILVDEIQCDHQNAASKLKTAQYGELSTVRRALQRKYNLDDAGFDALLDKYHGMMKNFTDIATQAIVAFAKKNGYPKLFWHTYESGKKLKQNSPPKSLYDKIPKENFFIPSQNKPFNLDGEFFEREAKVVNNLIKLARKFVFKYS